MKRLLYKKERIERINCVLKEYFCQNPNAGIIPAKDFMPLFIEAGIFNKDEKNGLPIRKLLRELDDSNELSSIPFVIKQQKAINRNWFFSDSDYSPIPEFSTLEERPNTRSNKSRENSDEYYVIGLCNEVLGIEAIHQATFDFLKDDTGAGLKVDAYYEPLKLVVEYMEIQHFKKGMYGNKYCPASGTLPIILSIDYFVIGKRILRLLESYWNEYRLRFHLATTGRNSDGSQCRSW